MESFEDLEISSKEYSPYLTSEEREYLAKQPNTLDRPLTEEELSFLDKNGYVVIKNLIEPEFCEKMAREALKRARDMLGVSEDDPTTWSKFPFHGCVDIWHLPTFYELRQNPKLYSIFCQLLKTYQLVPSIDRIGMKPPMRDDKAREVAIENNKKLPLHTDLNYWHSDPLYPQYQGGLCLRDCPVGGGGFFCIPGFHKRDEIDDYKIKFECGAFQNDPKPPTKEKTFIPFLDEIQAKKKVEVELRQGDFVIWNSNLPHNGGYNSLPEHWRLHAFVRFLPLNVGSLPDQKWAKEYVKVVKESALTGVKPKNYATGNTVKTQKTKDQEKSFHVEPKFTELGQKLFGIVEWELDAKQEKKVFSKKNRVQGSGWSK